MFNKKIFWKRKAISTTDYIFGTLSTVLMIIALVLIFNMLMSSCSSDTTHYMNERQISNLHKESLYLFLTSPVHSPNPIIPFKKNSYFYENENIKRHFTLPLDLNPSGVDFQIKVDDIDLIKTLELSLKPGMFSNIALIGDSLDNILPLFEERGIFPDIITWDELSSDHKYVIAGCSYSRNYDKLKLLNWINSGGQLITTDYSVKIIEDLFGKKFVYSNEVSIRYEPVKIRFVQNNILGLSGDYLVYDVFWTDLRNDSETRIIAEYVDVDYEPCFKTDEGCGAPIYMFDYGQGKVIHFSFHLDRNIEIANELINTFNFNFEDPKSFSIYYPPTGEKIFEKNQPILISLAEFDDVNLLPYFLDCDKDCFKTFTIKGDGRLLLRQPIMEIYSHGIYSYNQISMADYIVYALSKNDQDHLDLMENKIEKYLNSISNDVLAHQITFSREPEKKDEIFSLISKRYRENFWTADSIDIQAKTELMLYNNETVYITLESAFVTKTAIKVRSTILGIMILNFFIMGGPI